MIKRILTEGFRVFFLAAALWAIFSGLIWEAWLGQQAAGKVPELPGLAMSPMQWHAHEMIYGYAGAAVGGFFLTAVANGRGKLVALIAGLWLAGRIAIWYSASLSPALVAIGDLAFLCVLVARVAVQLLKARKPQHVIFTVFLLALLLGNLAVHLDWLGIWPGAAFEGLRFGLLSLIGLIIILGGRVTPGFVRNAMKRAEQPEGAWPPQTAKLDRASVLLALLLPWSYLLPALHPFIVLSLAVIHGLRVMQWRLRWALRDSLLWSLLVAQILVVAGLVLLASSNWGIGSEIGALHVLALGGVGGMTLAVMSRAILGHSGRGLAAPRPAVWAFAFMIVSTATRGLAADALIDWYDLLVLVSGATWLAAFMLFLFGYLRLLTAASAPRPIRPAPQSAANSASS